MSVGKAAASEMKKLYGMEYRVGTSPQILCKNKHTQTHSIFAPSQKFSNGRFQDGYAVANVNQSIWRSQISPTNTHIDSHLLTIAVWEPSVGEILGMNENTG